MQRLRTIVAIVMAWLWLPATQHCGLEAAGVLTAQCQHAGAVGCGDCAGDGCNAVESGSYKIGNGTPKVSAPHLAVCVCLVCLNAAVPVLISEAAVFSRSYEERPLEWVPSWQFARRAALLPGAPSLV